MGIENLFLGFEVAITPFNVWVAVLGIVLGTIIGVLPGLGGANGVAILLPVTFTMPPTSGIILLTSIYWGALFGGAITSILFNIPGEPWSVATTFDGYPMARRGEGGQALTAAFTSSFVGAFFSIVLITLFAPLLAEVALRFGPPEFFAIQFLTFSSFVGLGGGNPIKTIVAILLGFILGAVGLDIVTGQLRMTFGFNGLMTGFDFIIAVIGLFGIGEILLTVEEGLRFEGTKTRMHPRVVLDTWKILPAYWRTFLRSSFIGFWMGFKPGGATPASFMSYAFAKRFSKHQEKFGKGEIEGVVAPETAAHAAGVAAILPMITLGIPGSPTAAVMLGGLIIWGLQPGPLLFTEKPDFVWGLIASMYTGNIIGVLMVLAFVPFFGDPAHSLRHPDAADHRCLRHRFIRCAQQHARRLVHADIRRGRLRFQKARLSAGAARLGVGVGRPGGECAAPEPDYVARISRDLFYASDCRRDHALRDFYFYAADRKPLLAPAEGFAVSTARAAGNLILHRDR